jgi:hypothetical protein
MQLETAAANYSYLRGLLFLPGGALFILAALGNWGLLPDWAFIAGVLAIGAVSLVLVRYYGEHYGRIEPTTRQQLKGMAALGFGVAVMIGGSLALRSRASWSLDLPVNAIAVSFAVVTLASYAIGIGLKAHHIAIWGTLLVVGAVPLWTGADPSNVGLVLAGVATILSGLFDHRLFVRMFGPANVAALDG